MDGRITIDGYYRNGEYEIISHGDKPDPKAICSLTYSINHNTETSDLLHMMGKNIQKYIDNEITVD